MAIQYSTIIRKLVKKGSIDSVSDAVVEVHYRVLATNELGHNVGLNFVLNCDISPENFTPFDHLTEEEVIGWITNSMSENEWNNIKSSLDNQFDKLDVVDVPEEWFPWNPVE